MTSAAIAFRVAVRRHRLRYYSRGSNGSSKIRCVRFRHRREKEHISLFARVTQALDVCLRTVAARLH
jgi:hypothetical protein